eukprot:TRINITY_DN5607_c2_g1_i1.p1 TRINITY_DN5607_c2_g1~~TRINITY_DN5607_c2_g1_i1.p1  ORF type:complete len:199 (-),score=-20.75 TRINITY_DN5607_c2_g1_i1:180-776(-)
MDLQNSTQIPIPKQHNKLYIVTCLKTQLQQMFIINTQMFQIFRQIQQKIQISINTTYCFLLLFPKFLTDICYLKIYKQKPQTKLLKQNREKHERKKMIKNLQMQFAFQNENLKRVVEKSIAQKVTQNIYFRKKNLVSDTTPKPKNSSCKNNTLHYLKTNCVHTSNKRTLQSSLINTTIQSTYLFQITNNLCLKLSQIR